MDIYIYILVYKTFSDIVATLVVKFKLCDKSKL